MQKTKLRKEVLRLRDDMSELDVELKSKSIVDKIKELDDYKNAENVFSYFPFGSEVDVKNLIIDCLNNNKNVYLPKIISLEEGDMRFIKISSLDDVSVGCMNIMEPLENDFEVLFNNSFMIMPGVAFDRNFNRIGYGKGFYDRYLDSHKIDCKCAVAYDIQVLNNTFIDADEYDKKMDFIITENCILRKE